MDILAIRDRLNALPFRDGKRRVLIGRIPTDSGVLELLSDGNPPETTETIPAESADIYLTDLAGELHQNGLELTRGGDEAQDPYVDRIFVVQSLRHDSGRDMAWMRDAVNWTARVSTIGLEMVVPGIAGLWLDQKLGTRMLGACGFILGVVLGIWHLVRMTRAQNPLGRGVP